MVFDVRQEVRVYVCGGATRTRRACTTAALRLSRLREDIRAEGGHAAAPTYS